MRRHLLLRAKATAPQTVSKRRRTQTRGGRVMRRRRDPLKHRAATWAEANNRVAGAHSGGKSTRVSLLLMLIYASDQTGSTRPRRRRHGICGGYANAGVSLDSWRAGGAHLQVWTDRAVILN